MADFEPDQESNSRANELSSQLMNDLRTMAEEGPDPRLRRKLFSEDRYTERADGTPIDDVVENVAQMATDFAVVRHRVRGFPCIQPERGPVIPISLNEVFGEAPWPYRNREWLGSRPRPPSDPRYAWREVLDGAKEDNDDVRVTNISEATDGAHQHLNAFLSFRFSGIKMLRERMRDMFGSVSRRQQSLTGFTPGGGLQVQVSCLTPGLRLHVAPAYFVTWTVFGHPTSPVMNYLLPGRYIFAGDGPMMPRRKRDTGIFSIPPTFNPALTRF